MKNFIATHNKESIDLFDLLQFAYVFEIEPLIDCCTNLISLIATRKDLDVIQSFADLYDNRHLKLLCEYLTSKDNMIKV